MKAALDSWLRAAALGEDQVGAARAAAEAVAGDAWQVVETAGALARSRVETAAVDVGITERLDHVAVDSPRAVARVGQGAPVPVRDRAGRRRRGAFDTPRAMARRTVAAGLEAAGGANSARDPACGAGAFLVALHEAGVRDVYGSDLDPAAVAVAQVAVPSASLTVADGLDARAPVDLVVGNPPFVPPERQTRALREALSVRFPWLRGRYDLAVPFAAVCVSQARRGVSLVLPASLMVQPYAAPLRRRWIERHRVHMLTAPEPFPGATVYVVTVALEVGAGPAALPSGVTPVELLELVSVPLTTHHRPGDVAIIRHIRSVSTVLGDHCLVDTGLVAHGPLGGKARLLRDEGGPHRVKYADAREFFAGGHRWLEWRPEEMHRSKSPSMFERPKIVVQRLRGRRPIRAQVCRDGIYVGHTCTVVQPSDPSAPLDALAALIRDPLVDAVLRMERGARLDLYPRDVAAIPVPLSWCESPTRSLAEAWGLTCAQERRLRAWVES